MHNLYQVLHSTGPLDTQSSHICLCFGSEAVMLSERAYFHLPAPLFKLSKAELVLRRLRPTYDAMIDGSQLTGRLDSGKLLLSDMVSGHVRLPEDMASTAMPDTIKRHHTMFDAFSGQEKIALGVRAVRESMRRRSVVLTSVASVAADIHGLEEVGFWR